MKSRDVVAGLSLGNIVLIQAWTVAGSADYFYSGLPQTLFYTGLALDWLVAAAVFAAVSVWSRRGRWPLALSALIIAGSLIVPLDWLLRKAVDLSLPNMAARWGMGPVLVAHAAPLALIAAWPLLQKVVTRVLPIVLAPLIAVTVSTAVRPLVSDPPAAPPGLESPAAAPEGPLVVLMLFDEFDVPMLEGGRAGAPPLPAFQRLMSESFVASRVSSVSQRTLLTVPSMLTGKVVVSATPMGHDLMLGFAGGESGAWRLIESPFTRVRRLGYRTGAAGWFHPYCNTLPGQFDVCTWRPFEGMPRGVFDAMRRHAQEAVSEFSWPIRLLVPGLLQTPAQAAELVRHRAETYRVVAAAARAMTLEFESGLVFAHYSVPHLPGILDLVAPGAGVSMPGYFGNAVLADTTLASLRADLERAGRWDDVAIVISADHQWRTAVPHDDRVPLIVKLPGAPAAAVYERPLQATVLHDLLPRLVTGEIATPEQLARYLDSR